MSVRTDSDAYYERFLVYYLPTWQKRFVFTFLLKRLMIHIWSGLKRSDGNELVYKNQHWEMFGGMFEVNFVSYTEIYLSMITSHTTRGNDTV